MLHAMRFSLIALFCAVSTAVHAATAYDALGTVGKLRGDKTLDRVLEVRGLNGTPSPRSWKITVEDSAARSGVREFDVEGTKLVSERAPSNAVAGSPLNVNRLNLDSDGVNTIATREAKKAGYHYDHTDYVLRAGSKGGTPVWEVRLVDGQSGDIATLHLSADTGTVLSSDGLTRSRANTAPPPAPVAQRANRPEPRYTEPRYTEERPPEPRYSEPRQDRAGRRAPSEGLQRVGDGLNNFIVRSGFHMQRRFRQIGDKFHNLFTGDNRDTAGPHRSRDDYNDPNFVRPQEYQEAELQPQPRTYRDANGTEYMRPRD